MNRSIVWRLRRGWPAALMLIAALGVYACEQGEQGDRCNPDLIQSGGATPQYNEDECHSGLACTVPPTCVIAVCCPKEPPYSDPNCACLANPGAVCACSVPSLLEDAGEDGGADGAGSDATSSDATPGDATPPSDARTDAAAG
jgi:hypothetical protein